MNKEPERTQRRVLGKGLSALLPSRGNASVEIKTGSENKADVSLPVLAATSLPEHFEKFQSISLARIEPEPGQPRDSFDQVRLAELAQSIRAHGIIQPITVRKVAPERYRIVAGERRWRAAELAGLQEIPALVRSVPEDELLEFALIENLQREDLNPIEIATAFHKLSTDHHLSHEQIAQRTGKDRSTVTNFLRLLKLSSPVRSALVAGEISMGHARALLNLEPAQQEELCGRIQQRQLSVRETEHLVREITDNRSTPQLAEKKSDEAPLDPNVRAALEEMAMVLGTRVRLSPRSETSGRLEIEYYSQEDLDRIYSVIVKQ
jgi:ParB family transcriptional regulator, chromosome partitioning protein